MLCGRFCYIIESALRYVIQGGAITVAKRFILALIAALMLWLPCALAQAQAPLPDNEDWSYIGYIYGGITFAVPNDYMGFDISASEIAQGYVLTGGNADFSM